MGIKSENVKLIGIASFSITVTNLERSLNFYTQILPFEIISQREICGADCEKLYGVIGIHARIATLKLGDETIELIDYITPQGRDMPSDTQGNDDWFQHIAIAVSNMEKAYRHLCEHKVEHASDKPQTIPDWNDDAGGIKAFYFKDPDGNFLEIIWFPEDKRPLRWQNAQSLFIGIDHSAIVVRNTDEALRFYRDTLNMEVEGGSLNYGVEQEQLTSVKGAFVRITSLRGDFGPGIEFLEYLLPDSGRPFPSDAKVTDLFHWHATAKVNGLNEMAKKINDFNQGADAISPVTIKNNKDYSSALMVKGPSGHSLILTE